MLADSDAELPLADYVALWMSAQHRWARPHLGAHTGSKVPLGAYQLILDEERSSLAREYLRDPDLSVSEVAYMLGYSEPSAFTRAFTRWTGQSPRGFRGR